MLSINEMEGLAQRVRQHTVRMVHLAKSSHLGSSLSMVELLVALYGGILKVDPAQPDWPDRDRFILSKGHACASYYAVLAERGFFPIEWLDTFYQNGSRLAGHATYPYVPGVEIATGSLGHGLSVATGMALVAKRERKPYRIFCLLSDGECDEGAVWEAVLFAPQHQLDNLTIIVDYNKIQALGHTREVVDLEPFADKWRAFRWSVREIDGHNLVEIVEALTSIPYQQGVPNCIIAHTVKGKGISFMEDSLLWHYRSPQGEEYIKALAELGGSRP